jgi:DNA polymerase-4
VGGSRERGVVAAASYEARAFGVRSAMASAKAARLCPELVFRRPRFEVYRQVSQQIRAIFAEFTPEIEPLSLDEAYLDVTQDLSAIGSATRIAELIRARIKAETGLTASAGVSYNKLLAKLASDENKPDGLCVVRPGEGMAFVARMPVRRIHGVGPKAAEKMAKLGIHTGADLAACDIAWLRAQFGSMGDYLYRAARGIDLRPVSAHRARKSLGSERTFDRDISSGSALREALDDTIDGVWEDLAKRGIRGRTLTLKLRFADFTLRTHARSLARGIDDCTVFARLAHELLDEQLPLPQPVRLMGLTLSGIEGGEGEVDEAPSAAAPGDAGQLSLF